KETLLLLRPKFKKIFYLPGNHELWVRNEGCDSIEKLFRILELCDSLEVETRPARVDSVWVVPLFSWYSPSFDQNPDDSHLGGWSDFYFCKWPEGIGEISEYFSRMNETSIRSYDGPVIS